MATTVVAGRVDEEVKRKVDRILAREGRTAADVIKEIWINIAITGELPTTQQQEEAFREQRRRYQDIIEFVSQVAPAPEWAINLTDQEMHDMMVADMLEGERRFVEGGQYVLPDA